MYQLIVDHFELPAAFLASIANRGQYGEILSILTPEGKVIRGSDIIAMYRGVIPETFAEFDKKGRGDALNVDLYAYDADQDVAVIQIRHAFRRYRNGFLNVHKDYVLVGRNEITNELFRHPISGHAIHAGIRKDGIDAASGVFAAQRWMWGVTDAQLDAGIRQGDILMVPCKSRPKDAEVIDARVVTVGGTHEVHATAFARDAKGIVYAEGPTMRHTKGQHLPVYADSDGWHSIRVAEEAATWAWGVRLGD